VVAGRDHPLRLHAETHLRQIVFVGEDRFKMLYWAFSHFGYWLNPLEIEARMQECR